ncbi:putative mitochondrial mitochondrial carrier protein (MCP3) [Leptomonas pyrrhocoris]|uniref:Putative mitochondrial mitochondrial carrier protein (MCP3) n=1 Tax=Leptomonas pyrrhocoris TaxID=157538 RepID=A0A0M9GAU1_LEPPY|nr:putative mitochondrial mitochondrial carrier protein (MCP3) [Leptomonas pyrrhocoris]KPA86483.1 putative mitochondrial mitochondrial carrier protein (MCP3) [Leptomonas pyrrhocoris]|eukprot:XP_015664922.1 putative mitochondrial mitochondrial carrier protein (MCP3) [Leptomonas pyrrhocoris]
MEVACSAVAGICARVLCHPLDTVKTVAFTGFAGEHDVRPAARPSAAAVLQEAPRSSFISSARSIWVREGITGFYRGVGVAAVGSAPGVALYLTTYDRCSTSWKAFGDAKRTKDAATSESSRSGDGPAVSTAVVESLRTVAASAPAGVRFFVCGLAAETVSCVVWVPIDVAKERLQSQPPTLRARYTGSVDALRRILTNEGLRGLYKGYWSTLSSFGPFSAVYFVFYEYFTSVLEACYGASSLFQGSHRVRGTDGAPLPSSSAKFAVALGAGAGGNVVASLCTNPLELVKTRLQVQRTVLCRQAAAAAGAPMSSSLYAYRYEGLRDGLAQMAKAEGVCALWKGVGSRIASTAPNAALTMGFFELLKSKLM